MPENSDAGAIHCFNTYQEGKGRKMFEVQSSMFNVQGSRFKVQVSRFKVQGSRVSGFRFQVSGVSGFRLKRLGVVQNFNFPIFHLLNSRNPEII